MSEEMVNARRATFEAGDGWAHEGKKGWRCKISKMVDAGWTCDLSPETEDGATCFYCNLSLDGWEPKDDPLDEHKRRSPDCPFFRLQEQFGDVAPKKAKGRAKSKARTSTASKISRQSSVSLAQSEIPSFVGSVDEVAGADDSIMTAGTTSSQAGTKSKKTTAKGKAASKTGKGKKKTAPVEDEDEMQVQYPDLSQNVPQQEPEDEIRVSMSARDAEELASSQPKKPAKKGRQPKQVDFYLGRQPGGITAKEERPKAQDQDRARTRT
jgi:hypothetical protein